MGCTDPAENESMAVITTREVLDSSKINPWSRAFEQHGQECRVGPCDFESEEILAETPAGEVIPRPFIVTSQEEEDLAERLEKERMMMEARWAPRSRYPADVGKGLVLRPKKASKDLSKSDRPSSTTDAPGTAAADDARAETSDGQLAQPDTDAMPPPAAEQ